MTAYAKKFGEPLGPGIGRGIPGGST